ncbi:MAG: T9SS type A sorting domain-containing protein [Fibrobacteres bacterium]|nr:T9SS type A sorting domain-containing protein [Fibrobacterota bacterium]
MSKLIALTCLAMFMVLSLHTSITALSAFPLKVAVQQNLLGQFAPVLSDLNVADAPVTLEIVSHPSSGILDTATLTTGHAYYRGSSVRIPWFKYTPANNVTGRFTFSYRIHTASESTPVQNGTLIVYPPEPGNMTVLLIVVDTLLPRISTELNQLKADMESEGYAPRVTTIPRYSQSTVKQIWDTLSTEYDRPGKFMAGAIIIGSTLYPDQRTFWYMTDLLNNAVDSFKYGIMHNKDHRPGLDTLKYGFDATNAQHIWVSRLAAYYGETMKYGKGEADQIKRYLKANHEYRKGITRYQRKAYFHMAYASERRNYNAGKYLPLFTSYYADMRDSLPPSVYCFSQGGELLDAQYHANSAWYHAEQANKWKGIWTSDVYEHPISIRFYLTGGCNSGGISGITNSMLYTRNGGTLLAIGATAYAGTGVNTFIYKDHGAKGLEMLAAGERFGRVFIRGGVLRNVNNGIWGDLTLKPGMAPDNKMPEITSLTADALSGMAPLTVNLTVSASDSDGTISGYEWFSEGFNFGMSDPDVSGATATTARHVFTKPYLYRTRVEALDNYNARARKNIDIAVAPSCTDTLRVNCFAPQPYYNPALEYVDSTGKRWLHDQHFAAGTWGYVPRNFATGTAFNANYVPYKARTLASGNVLNTKAPTIFKNYIMPDSLNPVIWYKVTVPNGTYRLSLGFADCRALDAAKKATMDIDVEGQPWRTFSPFDSVGAKSACFIGRDVVVSDYELEFKVKTATASTDTAFLNCFELYSLSPSGCASVLENNKAAKVEKCDLNVCPNPFNPSTVVAYSLTDKEAAGTVSINIFSLDGKMVRSLYNGIALTGTHRISWNGRDNSGKSVTAGLYIVRMATLTGVKQIKVMLLK